MNLTIRLTYQQLSDAVTHFTLPFPQRINIQGNPCPYFQILDQEHVDLVASHTLSLQSAVQAKANASCATQYTYPLFGSLVGGSSVAYLLVFALGGGYPVWIAQGLMYWVLPCALGIGGYMGYTEAMSEAEKSARPILEEALCNEILWTQDHQEPLWKEIEQSKISLANLKMSYDDSLIEPVKFQQKTAEKVQLLALNSHFEEILRYAS